VNTPWRRITADCAHRSTICLACLQNHIQNQLEMNTVAEIPCTTCNGILALDDIKAWTVPEFFEPYGRISVQQAVHEGHSFRWCVGRGCQNGFLCDPDSESYAMCDKCGQVTCLSCNVAYHEGVSCKDFQDQKARAEKKALARRKEERRCMVEVRRISVRCPGKKCGVRIQKYAGCDHMICK
jgi:IBR domain, a half RING-finger domain